MIRIVQISDLHFGSEFKPEKFSRAIEQINALEPDLVVVSGDIVTWGIHREFREAYEALGNLNSELFAIPGNHDARNDGIKYFRLYFGEPKKQIKLDDVVIVGVNSTLPDSDDGYIGEEQRRWAERKFRKSCTNVLVLHHHIVPVPHTGRNRNVLIDAGEIVESLMFHCHGGVVLAGHRHVPYSTKLLRTHIIHAGTLSSYKVLMPDNNYNIIEIDGESIRLTLKFVDYGEIEIGKFMLKRGMPRAISLYHNLTSTKSVAFVSENIEIARQASELFNRMSPENMHAAAFKSRAKELRDFDWVVGIGDVPGVKEVWKAENLERRIKELIGRLLRTNSER